MFRSTVSQIALWAFTVCCVNPLLHAADVPTYDGVIRPLLRKHCQACHNSRRNEAGLDLSTYEGIQNGGDLGSVVTPGDAEDSLLYLVVAHLEEPAMPPGDAPLSVEIQQQIARWIDLKIPRSSGDVVEESRTAPTQSPQVQGATNLVDAGLVFEPNQPNPITAVAVSLDGLVARAGQRQIIVQDSKDGSLVSVLAYPEGECFDLEFAEMGQRLMAAGGMHSESGHITLWNVQSGTRVAQHCNEIDVLLAAAVSPDGTRVVSGGPQGILRVGDAKTGRTIWQTDKHTDWILDVAIDPAGLMLASADRSGNVYVWDLENGDRIHVLNGHNGAVPQVAWVDSGNRLITVCADGDVRSWDMHWGKLIERSKVDPDGLLGVAVDAADRVTTVGRSTGVQIREEIGGEITHQSLETQVCCEVSASPDLLAVGTFDGEVFVRRRAPDSGWNELKLPAERVTDDLNQIVAIPRLTASFVDLRSVAEQFIQVEPPAPKKRPSVGQTNVAMSEVTDFSWLAKRLAIERDRHSALLKELKDLEEDSRSVAQVPTMDSDGSLLDLINHLESFRQRTDESRLEGPVAELGLLVMLTLEKAKAVAASGLPISDESTNLQLRLDAIDQDVTRWEEETLFPPASASHPWIELRRRLEALQKQLSDDASPTMIVD